MVEYIKYNNKNYPIRLKYYAIQKFKAEIGGTDEEVLKALSSMDFDTLKIILFYALESGAKALDPDATLDLERKEMFNVLEECFAEFVAAIPKFFPEAEVAGKKLVNRPQRRATEKAKAKAKVPPKKSKE